MLAPQGAASIHARDFRGLWKCAGSSSAGLDRRQPSLETAPELLPISSKRAARRAYESRQVYAGHALSVPQEQLVDVALKGSNCLKTPKADKLICCPQVSDTQKVNAPISWFKVSGTEKIICQANPCSIRFRGEQEALRY